ncbi:MAG: DUF92 domain-containing protein [Chloroflexales bacterium]|nr:DUF92 domain-containing protein [Chloroflexales bacterium]
MTSLDLPRILLGLVLSAAIGGAAYWRGSLTRGGWAGAILSGTCTFGFGGLSWGVLLIVFFVTSSLLSRFKQVYKARLTADTFAKGSQRDLAQVLANGGIPALLALLYPLLGQPSWLYSVYIGVLATVTADTWATEIGVLSRAQPRLITTGKRVAPGTSGGITSIGTAATAAGGLCIGVVAAALSADQPPQIWVMLPILGLASGIVGSLTDSLLGATAQVMYRRRDGRETERPHAENGTPHTYARGIRWMNNDLVNLLSSVAGGLVAWLGTLIALAR